MVTQLEQLQPTQTPPDKVTRGLGDAVFTLDSALGAAGNRGVFDSPEFRPAQYASIAEAKIAMQPEIASPQDLYRALYDSDSQLRLREVFQPLVDAEVTSLPLAEGHLVILPDQVRRSFLFGHCVEEDCFSDSGHFVKDWLGLPISASDPVVGNNGHYDTLSLKAWRKPNRQDLRAAQRLHAEIKQILDVLEPYLSAESGVFSTAPKPGEPTPEYARYQRAVAESTSRNLALVAIFSD